MHKDSSVFVVGRYSTSQKFNVSWQSWLHQQNVILTSRNSSDLSFKHRETRRRRKSIFRRWWIGWVTLCRPSACLGFLSGLHSYLSGLGVQKHKSHCSSPQQAILYSTDAHFPQKGCQGLNFERQADTYHIHVGGFHVMSSWPCWWTRTIDLSLAPFCSSTSICTYHHCYLCLWRLVATHL